MQKRKSLFSIVLVVLVLVLAVAMLVACNDQKAKYTITFDDGSEVPKTVTLEEGTALTAEQIPTAKTVEGKNFDGWYIGETLVEAGYKPTANVTAVAKYSTLKVNVKFVNGNDMTNVVVDYNTAIASDKLPADAQPSDSRIFEFEGWFDGETKFASNMAFTADKTFTAKFKRTGYIVTISNEATQPSSVERVIAKNEDGVALLPEGLLPTNVPTVENKVFVGFYNGSVKMSAGMEITDDITIKACYVGKEDYDGLWADDQNKFVVLFDIDNDSLYFGTSEVYYSYLEFDDENGNMEYNRGYGTVWSLSILGDSMTVVKTPTSGAVQTFVMTKVTNSVDFAGKYIRNSAFDVLNVVEGGYLFGSYGPKYQYAKISENGGVYTLTVADDEGNVQTVNAVIDNIGIITLSGDISEAGVWLKDAEIELNIQDANYETRIRKYDVNGTFVYVFVDEDGIYSVVTPSREITEDGNGTVTLTFKDNSTRVIKLVPNDEYLLAGAESGTYTLTVDNETQTMVLDGFGTATFSGGDKDAFKGDTAYVVKGENLIYITEFELTVQLNGDNFSILEADIVAGEYYQLNNNTYNSKLEFDGFGNVTLWTGSYGYNKVVGTYTLDENAGTVTIVGVQYEEEVYNGTYEIIFDGETLVCNGTYFGKAADDQSASMVGKWYIPDTNNSIEISKSAYSGALSVVMNGTDATDIVPLKYDNTALMFTVEGVVYTVTLGDMVDGNYTLKLSSEGEADVIYNAAPSVNDAFIGTWVNDDETIKVVIVDSNDIQADFSEDTDTLNTAILIASNRIDNSITIKVNDVNYVLSYEDGFISVKSAENESIATLQKEVAIDAKFVGSWKAQDEQYTLNLVITEKKVTLNGQQAINVESGYSLTFVVNGVNYTFWALSSYELDFDGLEISMVDANASSGGDVIIPDTRLYGTWTWEDSTFTPTSGTLVISADGVTLNGNEVQNLVYIDTRDGFTFDYEGHSYNVYKPSYGSAQITVDNDSANRTSLEQQ